MMCECKGGELMREFMDKDFLLECETAKELYHNYAEKMPIIDYHCHIDPREIFEDKRFADLTDAWLGADHYKWRIMRASGISERYITGDANPWKKFRAFADAVPRAIGNPVNHWVHLELQRFFGNNTMLTPDTAREIWDMCNERLINDETLSVRGIIKRSRVEVIVTTDDPIDSLEWHKKLADDDTFETKVLPGWRPDRVLDIESTDYINYIQTLGETSGVLISDFTTLKTALENRINYFNSNGCCACDHGQSRIPYAPAGAKQIGMIIRKRLRSEDLTVEEVNQYKYAVMNFCAKEYYKHDWIMELHLGVKRNVNSMMFNKLGANTGFDCSDPADRLSGLAEFLNELNTFGSLPKTLIFSIDPADDHAITTLAGCFQQEYIKSKVQQGCAWWFNDTFTGMQQQLIKFAEQGVLANFIGMLTDSRSFLSYTRHEYFRRILCNLLGGWAEAGLCTTDIDYLGGVVKDICYNNVKEFFGF